MKQRIITLLLAAALCLPLAACDEETSILDDAAEIGGEVSSDRFAEQEDVDTAVPVAVDGMTLGAGLEEGEAVAELDENPNRAIRRSTKPIVQTVGAMLDGTRLPSSHYLYRNTLNDTYKQAYDLIRSGLLEGRATIEMTVPVSTDDIFTLFKMVVYDSPEMVWAETSMSYSFNNYGNVVTVTPEYNDLVRDIEGVTARMEAAVSEAMADLWSLDSDGERAKYAHDYLTHTIDYVSGSSYNQTAYSALVNGQTVCAGYSKAFQYMMQKLGIPCAYVVGWAGENHAWNVVELDGDYYAMDVTWDDPIGSGPNVYYYNYFNITDNQMSADHTRRDISEDIPWANGTALSYQNAFGGNAYGTDFDSIQGDLSDDDGDSDDNPYLPDDHGGTGDDNPYLPDGYDGGDETDIPDSDWDDTDWDDWVDSDWYDFDWNDWSYDDYEELGYDWWNALDESWTLDDWTDYGDGMWEIWDEETQCYYFYDESDGTFGCMDANDETFYLLNYETGEWISLN